MAARYLSVWFRHLPTDWHSLIQPELKYQPFVLRSSIHGRMVITAANQFAEKAGINTGMVLADARAIQPDLVVKDHQPEIIDQVLQRIATWCIRFTPSVATDWADGLNMDVTGCSHLWGGDNSYVEFIRSKLTARGYDVRIAMADTVGVAWAMARFGRTISVVASGKHIDALLRLPPEALRLEPATVLRLHKLGLHQIRQFISIPRASLRRRFGNEFLTNLDKATGHQLEMIESIIPPEPYQVRLPALDPIVTATGIELALKELLTTICARLLTEQKGLRTARLKCYRVDNRTEEIEIGTHRPTHHVQHIFKLFELKIQKIDPGLGIELFILDATRVEDHSSQQEKIWEHANGLEDERLSELIDKLALKVGNESIVRFLPDEHYWPERSCQPAKSLTESPATSWRTDRPRPVQLLTIPEKIEVTAPIPDYPPMLFRHQGKIHKIIKADGPERIEQEWWLQQGQHRDYYQVEDEQGQRYWLFRLGHYHESSYQWFLHGFFA